MQTTFKVLGSPAFAKASALRTRFSLSVPWPLATRFWLLALSLGQDTDSQMPGASDQQPDAKTQNPKL